MDPFVLKTLRKTKRVTLIVVGFTILLIGIAMIVLPGPAFIMIPIALGILGTELVWAKKLLNKMKSKFLNPNKKE
jgi:tellurite resistance protein TerC